MSINQKLIQSAKLWSRERDIVQWGIDRNIIGDNAQATFESQLKKTEQEWNEWKENHSKDDIGDIFVTLVMGAALLELTLTDCVKGVSFDGFSDISDADDLLDFAIMKYLGNKVDVDLLNDKTIIIEDLRNIVVVLFAVCELREWGLRDCIEVAWDDIKDRKGLMVHGMFFKQLNLEELYELGIVYDRELQAFQGTYMEGEPECKKALELLNKLGLKYKIFTRQSEYTVVQSIGLLD